MQFFFFFFFFFFELCSNPPPTLPVAQRCPDRARLDVHAAMNRLRALALQAAKALSEVRSYRSDLEAELAARSSEVGRLSEANTRAAEALKRLREDNEALAKQASEGGGAGAGESVGAAALRRELEEGMVSRFVLFFPFCVGSLGVGRLSVGTKGARGQGGWGIYRARARACVCVCVCVFVACWATIHDLVIICTNLAVWRSGGGSDGQPGGDAGGKRCRPQREPASPGAHDRLPGGDEHPAQHPRR